VSWAKVERYQDDVLGSIIINVADKDMNKVTNYLTSMGVAWEYAE
jgi:D-methionine transport system ATP-binding protein